MTVLLQVNPAQGSKVYGAPGALRASEVAEYFPECPFCHTSGSMNISSDSDFVLCSKCGSKWKVRKSPSTSEIVSMKLVTIGTNERGLPIKDKLSWIDMNRKPEFWRQKAIGIDATSDVPAAASAILAAVVCPRCGAKMRWIRRVNTYICDNDGYLLGKQDPFVLTGEVVPAHNQGGQYNH